MRALLQRLLPGAPRDHAAKMRRVEEDEGADFVSVGALTHSVQAADISFEIESPAS